MVIRRIARMPSIPNTRLADDPVPDWSEAELVSALASGDPRAGVALYDRLIRVVEWTISRVMGQRSSDHEDLVQTAFEQIVITLHAERYAQRCSLTSWASAVSCHVALNALRARRRRRALHEQSVERCEAQARVDPENQLAAREALERIRSELARMNPARAEALVLHEVNGLGLPELASVLGISVVAAQSRVSRGRRELMARIEAAAKGGEAP
jgi:RNA polymerase sigma-70 factor (ECF subfamily)